MAFGREGGFYDPFDNDDAGDSRSFKQAMTILNDEVSDLNFMENDMATTDEKPAAKKTVTKKVADAKPAEKAAPAKKTVAPKAADKPAAKPAAKKATSAGPRGLAVPEGHVGLDKIAKDLKTTPAALRRKLRNAENIEKPTSGVWAWKEGSKDLEKVIKFLTPKAESK